MENELTIDQIDQIPLKYLSEEVNYPGLRDYWPYMDDYDEAKMKAKSLIRYQGRVLPEWTQTAANGMFFSGSSHNNDTKEMLFKYGFQASQTLLIRAKEGVDFHAAFRSIRKWSASAACSHEQKNSTVCLAFYKWFEEVPTKEGVPVDAEGIATQE
jgi:hypothetical protein